MSLGLNWEGGVAVNVHVSYVQELAMPTMSFGVIVTSARDGGCT